MQQSLFFFALMMCYTVNKLLINEFGLLLFLHLVNSIIIVCLPASPYI